MPDRIIPNSDTISGQPDTASLATFWTPAGIPQSQSYGDLRDALQPDPTARAGATAAQAAAAAAQAQAMADLAAHITNASAHHVQAVLRDGAATVGLINAALGQEVWQTGGGTSPHPNAVYVDASLDFSTPFLSQVGQVTRGGADNQPLGGWFLAVRGVANQTRAQIPASGGPCCAPHGPSLGPTLGIAGRRPRPQPR